MSWEDLDFEAVSNNNQSEDEESATIHRSFKRIFATDDGQAVLRHLEKRTLRQSVMPAHSTDGAAMALLQNFRLGENNLYNYIVQQIEHKEEQKDDAGQSS